MKKIVTIGGKEYSMKSSAYTQFKYKNDTGRKLLEDIQGLEKFQDANEDLGVVDDLTERILKIAFIMIEEADSTQVKSFEEFLKSIDGLYDEQQWVEDVMSLAISPFSRGIQRTSPQQKEQQNS